MNAEKQNKLWIGLFIAIVLGMLWQFFPLSNAQERVDSLPLFGIGYKGKNVPLTEFEADFFKGVNVLKREYRIGNSNFFVTVLDGTNNRHVVHDPYYCFQGSGWSVISKHSMKVPQGEAALVRMSKDDVQREAAFWYSDIQHKYYSPFRYWWETTLRRLTLGVSGVEPVLIMIQPLDTSSADWSKLKENFNVIFDI